MCKDFCEFKSSRVQIFAVCISWFLFSHFGWGSQKSQKFGPRENFPLYSIQYNSEYLIQSNLVVKNACPWRPVFRLQYKLVSWFCSCGVTYAKCSLHRHCREICSQGGFDPVNPTGLPIHLPYKSMLTLVSTARTPALQVHAHTGKYCPSTCPTSLCSHW